MSQSPSLAKLAVTFLGYIVSVRNFSPHTAKSYGRAIDDFRGYLQGAGVDDTLKSFTATHLQDFAMYLAERGRTPNTIVIKLSGLSSFADFLMKRTDHRDKPLLASNPCRQFDWPTVSHAETPFLYPDELRAFLAAEIPKNEQVARAVLFDTGMRASELCNANVGDFVEMGGAWMIGVIVKGKGTRQRHVYMPLSPETAALVRDALYDRGLPTDNPDKDAALPLLVNQLGGRYSRSTLASMMERIAKAAGVTRFHMSPHKVRHTINVVRDAGGVNDFTRSRMLGQSNVRSQERYRHVVPGELIEAKAKQAAGLAKYLGDPPKD